MKKKAVNKMKPTITNLPIAVSDNPVVIDLPDGQKLVLGKMSSGSVIEVALGAALVDQIHVQVG